MAPVSSTARLGYKTRCNMMFRLYIEKLGFLTRESATFTIGDRMPAYILVYHGLRSGFGVNMDRAWQNTNPRDCRYSAGMILFVHIYYFNLINVYDAFNTSERLTEPIDMRHVEMDAKTQPQPLPRAQNPLAANTCIRYTWVHDLPIASSIILSAQ